MFGSFDDPCGYYYYYTHGDVAAYKGIRPNEMNMFSSHIHKKAINSSRHRKRDICMIGFMLKFADLLRRRESRIRGEVRPHNGVDNPREGEGNIGAVS